MPYIKKEDRDKFVLYYEDGDMERQCEPEDFANLCDHPGELNYLITCMIRRYIEKKGKNYGTYNEVIGVLECAKQELYSRSIVGYEAEKERINGDVYDTNASSTNIAWAGGFFEGEGCFYAHKHPPREDNSVVFRTTATLTQKDKSLLEQFKNVVKCGIVYGPDKKDMYCWKSTKVGEAKKVFDLLRPYLGERRQGRFLELYEAEKKQVFRPSRAKPDRKLCKNGHKMAEAGKTKQGACLTCDRAAKKRYYRKNKAGAKE